jgi:hypothetical protein
MGLRGGLHLFTYAHGNPILFRDFVGLQAEGCCEQAFEAGFFKKAGGAAGGITICCNGQKVACANPMIGNPMFDVPGELLINRCVVKHEEDHFDDIPCSSDCKLERPNFRLFVSQRKAECSASKKEVECLRRSISACGGNPNCLMRLDKRMKQIVSYGNSFGQCPSLQ